MDMPYTLLSIIVLFAGLLMIINPEFVWKVKYSFIVQNGEPTKYSLAVIRIFGIIFILIDIFTFLFVKQ